MGRTNVKFFQKASDSSEESIGIVRLGLELEVEAFFSRNPDANVLSSGYSVDSCSDKSDKRDSLLHTFYVIYRNK